MTILTLGKNPFYLPTSIISHDNPCIKLTLAVVTRSDSGDETIYDTSGDQHGVNKTSSVVTPNVLFTITMFYMSVKHCYSLNTLKLRSYCPAAMSEGKQHSCLEHGSLSSPLSWFSIGSDYNNN